jgi:hypothetical protein
MAPPSNTSTCVSPFPLSQTSIDALERLRESYEGLLAQAALTELDQVVLMAVELTLKHVRKEEVLA